MLPQWRQRLADPSHNPVMLVAGSEPGDDQGVTGPEVVLLRHERCGERVQTSDDDVHVPRQGGDGLSCEAQHVAARLPVPRALLAATVKV